MANIRLRKGQVLKINDGRYITVIEDCGTYFRCQHKGKKYRCDKSHIGKTISLMDYNRSQKNSPKEDYTKSMKPPDFAEGTPRMRYWEDYVPWKKKD